MSQETSSFSAQIERVLTKVGGDWLVLNEDLLELENVEYKTVAPVDLDFVRHASASENPLVRELFPILMEDAGLDQGLVNPRVTLPLGKVEGWRRHLLPWRVGEKGRIFQPDLTLFCALKILVEPEGAAPAILSALRRARGPGALDWGVLKTWLSEKQVGALERIVASSQG